MSETDLIRNDLSQSAAALGSQPLLIGITLLLGVLPLLLKGVAVILVFPLALFEAGFVGTQRILFLRAYRHKPFRTNEIWSLTLPFVGRMLVLGIVMSLVLTPIAIAALFLGGFPEVRGTDVVFPAPFLATLAILTLLSDVALTFVVPALAFTTKSVREAFRKGFRMIGETWPGSAIYVLTPGLAASTLGLVIPPAALGLGGRILLVVIGAVLGLWFKGAIAALYLRLHPETADDGAAHLP